MGNETTGDAFREWVRSLPDERHAYRERGEIAGIMLRNRIVRGITESYAKSMIKPSNTNRLIGYLMNGEVIKQMGDGWAVFDNTFLSVLLTMR